MPEDTLVPVLLALAMTVLFVGLLLKLWPLVALSGLGCAACVLRWLWPARALYQREGGNG